MALKFQEYIDAMTLEEKASLLSGANFWNTKSIERLSIPSIILTDGPHGLRKQAGKADHLGIGASVPATCFPTAAALANSWDEQLIEQVGQAIGREAASHNVSVLLGPGLNIVRDPLAGRTFEYFSEDPYVSGKLAAALVRGIQSTGVAATPKHFAVNSQEHLRMSIDEVVDERTMREIYLEGFRRVVEESQPRVIMTSYNKVNGVYANENTHLLQDIVTREWQYSGAIVTDWGGNHDRVSGLIAGNTLEMPSSNGITDKELVKAVREGKIDESLVDTRVRTLLGLIFETTKAIKDAPAVDYDMHNELAIEAAERSMVLLKNDKKILPIAEQTRVALIGDFAKTPRYQGAGSSLVNPTRITSALDAFSEDDVVELVGYTPGFKRRGGKSSRLIREAIELALQADVAIVFIGLDESKEAEGIDRDSMQLPTNQLVLLRELCKIHTNIVVVLAAGGPVEMPFADDVAGIIHSSLSGQGVGEALKDIIIGRRNPSGKLAVSYPFYYSDTPTERYFPGKEVTAEHREGLYVGYRYYETAEVPVRFPFGYGLSYSTFSYDKISVNEQSVQFSITNNSDVLGEEIAQVYIRPPKNGVFRPTRELKGFVKVKLLPGQTKQVSVTFDKHTFAYYDTLVHSWVKAAGEYVVEVGSSAHSIHLSERLSVTGVTVHAKSVQKALSSYYSGKVKEVSDVEFETLLGRPLTPALWNRKKQLTYDDTIAQLQYGHLRGRILYGVLRAIRKTLFVIHKPYLGNNIVFIMNLPFSKIVGFSGGRVSKKQVMKFLKIKKT